MSEAREGINENYRPSEREEKILAVLKEGRANPTHLHERTDERRQYINRALNNLMNAGWVRRVTKGLYELVEDPRDDG